MPALECKCGSTKFRRFKSYQQEIIHSTDSKITSTGQVEVTFSEPKEWACVRCDEQHTTEEDIY